MGLLIYTRNLILIARDGWNPDEPTARNPTPEVRPARSAMRTAWTSFAVRRCLSERAYDAAAESGFHETLFFWWDGAFR